MSATARSADSTPTVTRPTGVSGCRSLVLTLTAAVAALLAPGCMHHLDVETLAAVPGIEVQATEHMGKRLDLEIRNGSAEDWRIDWDASSYVGPDGRASRLLVGATPASAAEIQQTPTPLPAGAWLEESCRLDAGSLELGDSEAPHQPPGQLNLVLVRDGERRTWTGALRIDGQARQQRQEAARESWDEE